MIDDNVLSILLDACKPLFELVSGTDSKNSTMKPADLLMSTAKLVIAAGYKMKEQARQEMAEEDLGGGMFDQDVKNMRDFASKVASEPQVYDADERQQLDVTLVRFNTEISLRKYKTGTKLCEMVGSINLNGSIPARINKICHSIKKHKWRTILFEFLSIVSFAKPGVDAYRVASGAEAAEGASMDPLAEMIYTRGGELVFEAVPGLVLQLVAALNAEENTTSVFASLIISTASAALTGTTVFWDIDTDPGKRKRNPDWIGIVPDLGRGTAFATIFAMCAFQIFAKATATALLAVTDPSWLWYYVLGDYGLYFATP
ncbi:hypothetical protein TeGR_g14227 [Tetraparma gracilis]|uniref:Uncharacterized protein n=1 Tax=Tetraparma gracilis TaxID=2962635 RepID=A0ABQ6MPG9_9STRA|nr:hypothetical protein TeGR_g14227 [Tetraparma gracilis]